ncbi:MAG: hypothetical protein EGQ35_06605 [Clostridiales bacterium]|nr:hypothetical protein [Clostridiales bacterium]
MYMKKFVAFIMAILMVSQTAYAETANTDSYNIHFDTDVFVYNEKTTMFSTFTYDDDKYVPLRAISNFLGKEVSYNSAEGSINIMNSDKDIQYQPLIATEKDATAKIVDNKIMYNNVYIFGNESYKRTGLLNYDGNIYVPMNWLITRFGLEEEYDKNIITISDKKDDENSEVADIVGYDFNKLEKKIKSEYSYFNPDDYERIIKPVHTDDESTYRVYYEKYINGFDTNTGFYAVIKNKELYYLTERTTDYDLDLLATKTVNLTDDVIEEAKQIAANQIEDRYFITDQTVDKMIIDGMYSLVVNTTYAIDYGTEDQAFSCKSYTYSLRA